MTFPSRARRRTPSAWIRWVLVEPSLLRGLSWRRVSYTFLVGGGLALWSASANWMLERLGPRHVPVGLEEFAILAARFGSSFLLIMFVQMLALTMADNARFTGAIRFIVLTLALVLATFVGVALVDAVYYPEVFGWPIRRILEDSAYQTTGNFVRGALFAVVYFKWRRDHQIAEQLHAAEMARVELQRKTLESDLQTMQAQVEPQFLFNTLERIEAIYESDFAGADRMLDSLILYLRSALPHMRSSHSTLGQEIDLVRAYLDIECGCAARDLALEFDVAAETASAEFPPMLLLPLVQALVAPEADVAHDDAMALNVMARRHEGTLALALMRSGGRPLALAALDDLRHRLSALYGATARLMTERRGSSGLCVDVQIPFSAPEPIAPTI